MNNWIQYLNISEYIYVDISMLWHRSLVMHKLCAFFPKILSVYLLNINGNFFFIQLFGLVNPISV